MREDPKEKFVLLSKIAKEKKYAQEYLGLLARRGDIGSIRIGKRWYTTWQWFSEFLENNQKKKESVSKVKNFEAEKVKPLKAQPVEEKTIVPVQLPKNEEKIVFVSGGEDAKSAGRVEIRRVAKEDKITISVRTTSPTPRQNIRIEKIKEGKGDMGRVPIPVSFRANQAENKREFIQKETGIQNKSEIASPVFAANDIPRRFVFATFAFATSFAIIFFLLVVSGYFAFSGSLLERGEVAGASDERNDGLPGIRSESNYYLTNTGNKMKESFSISRVLIEAAKEKTADNEQETKISGQ